MKARLEAAQVVLTVGIMVLSAHAASALINPEFTPVDVVAQSDLILRVQARADPQKPEATLKVLEALKGESPGESLTIDLSGAWDQGHIDAWRSILEAVGDESAILFAGELESKGGVGLLHVGGNWFRLVEIAGHWELEGLDTVLEGTWAGGTDMLIRATRYILREPYPVIPVAVGTDWADILEVGNMSGAVRGLQAVDLVGDGRLHLFVACESGDKLFQYVKEGDTFKEVTEAAKLGSKSHVADWGDFNGDGRLDLASWDGKTLNLWLQVKDGTFAAQLTKATGALPETCLGLSALDAGVEGKAGLLVSTLSAPVLLVPVPDNGFRVVGIPYSAELAKDLGRASACLLADFDGDRVNDILQPFTKGSLFYRGEQAGGFAPPKACAVALGEAPAGAFLGDFDADGRLDVFTASADSWQLWENRGEGDFIDTVHLAGEVAYIARAGGSGGALCDINTDGRQDLLIIYADDFPQVFFNRGFRSTGFAPQLQLDELLPEAEEGQQAVTVADLNGDGAHDVVLALKSGSIHVLLGASASGEALCVQAVMPPGTKSAGPITVQAWVEGFSLGAWNLKAGSAGALFGMMEAGPCKVRWQYPKGKLQEKEVLVEDRPERLLLTP